MFQLAAKYVCNDKLAELFAKVVVAPNSAEVANGKKFTLAIILNRKPIFRRKRNSQLVLENEMGEHFQFLQQREMNIIQPLAWKNLKPGAQKGSKRQIIFR